EFKGDEIDKFWQISVLSKDYEPQTFEYKPNNVEHTKDVILNKISTQQAPHGANPENSPSKNPPTHVLYKLQSLPWWVYSALGLFVVLIVILIFQFYSDASETNTQKNDSEINLKINAYIEGIALNLDTLNDYKIKCNESTEKPDFCLKIDNVITIRKAINDGKIDDLKGKNYSDSQQNFKNAIDNIDDKFKEQIGNVLNKEKVSAMNLNEIADLIQNTQKVLKDKESDDNTSPLPIDNSEFNKKVNAYINGIELKSNILDKYQKECKTKNATNDPALLKKIDNAIAIRTAINMGKIDDMKGKQYSELQQNFKKAIDDIDNNFKEGISKYLFKQKVSAMNLNEIADLIQKKLNELKQNPSGNSLEDEFWKLVRSGNNEKSKYENLLKKFKKENKKGDIFNYLEKIENKESFEKFKDIDLIKRETATKLEDIQIN
ncbi:MAG: hypothetical protein QM535_22315, partial [Limnohabitans sp.]|nr:hypothetical protein [Limnohabitans sp.]